MKIKKEYIKPTLVLGIILLAVALLMAGVNMITSPIIEEAETEAIMNSLREVMPGGDFEEATKEYNSLPENVTAVYRDKNGGGYVITLSTSEGYTGQPIPVTVGIDNDGRITGIAVINSPETKDTDKVASYFGGFGGKDLSGLQDAELVSGVTYSSTAIKNAALDAYRAIGYEVAEPEVAERGGEFGGWSIAGIVTSLLLVGSFVAYEVIKRRKGI